ncbi:MAG: hypothetical protein PHQ27_02915 [Victivallales bacterium]|nr:hypothetical protein [Victivallales bacterium]
MAVAVVAVAAESPSEQTDGELAREIIRQEIIRNKCSLSDREKRDALAFFLKKKHITMESFAAVKTASATIIAGLETMLSGGSSYKEVYDALNMEKHGITLPVWQTYVRRYKTKDDIAKLKAYVPDNMDKIIATGYTQFGFLLEKWRLHKKIIAASAEGVPGEKHLTDNRKEQQWWRKQIGKYQLSPDREKRLLQFISVAEVFPPSDEKIIAAYFCPPSSATAVSPEGAATASDKNTAPKMNAD